MITLTIKNPFLQERDRRGDWVPVLDAQGKRVHDQRVVELCLSGEGAEGIAVPATTTRERLLAQAGDSPLTLDTAANWRRVSDRTVAATSAHGLLRYVRFVPDAAQAVTALVL